MGVYGDSISDTVPSVGDPETTASASVSALLTEFKTRLTAKVTPASFNINDDIDMNSNALSELAYAAFITQTSNPATNETLFTKLVGSIDELHYKDSSGQVTQVTDDGALNVAATGAITGAGYGSGGVAVNWNSAGSNYQMKSGSGSDDYASVTMDECQLRDGSSHSVNLKSPSLSASYDLTFPSALPAEGAYLVVDASGNITVPGARSRTVNLQSFYTLAGSITPGIAGVPVDNTADSFQVELPVEVGWKIHSIEISGFRNDTASYTVDFDLLEGTTQIGTVQYTGAVEPDVSLTPSTDPHTVVADKRYFLRMDAPSSFGGVGFVISYIAVTYSPV